MNEKEYREELKELLNEQGLAALRRYGRDLQMKQPTGLKKAQLIEGIIEILCGEVVSERGNKGAPVKDRVQEKHIAREVAALQREFGISDEEEQEEQEEQAERTVHSKLLRGSAPTANLSLTVSLNSLTVMQKKRLMDLIDSF